MGKNEGVVKAGRGEQMVDEGIEKKKGEGRGEGSGGVEV